LLNGVAWQPRKNATTISLDDQGVENFHHYDKKHWRQRVSLPQTASMAETTSWPPIDKHFSAGRGQQDGQQVHPTLWEADVA
jgi:hypothetical protein